MLQITVLHNLKGWSTASSPQTAQPYPTYMAALGPRLQLSL